MPIAIEVDQTKIARVGRADRSRLVLDGTEVALPRGAVILPGLVDTHCHLIGPGQMAERIDLHGAHSAPACVDRVAAAVADRSDSGWALGFGWNQEEWKGDGDLHRTLLDAVAPDRPVALYRIDTHAIWANTAALAAAGLLEPSTSFGPHLVRDRQGEPTGLLLENAVKIIEAALPPPSDDDIARWYRYGVRECLQYGLTAVHDMTVASEWIGPLVRLSEGGEIGLRCALFLDGKGEWTCGGPGPGRLGPNLDAAGVKFFADGALGSRGALLLEPYADAPETHGIGLMSSDELVERARAPLEAGFAIATHAIGDGANRCVLDAYDQLRRDFPGGLLRIEHAQIVHPDDVPRFASLGVIPAVQPTHCTSDAMMAERRLGNERCRYAYGWRNLRAVGVPLLGGSDFPIESPDPLAGMRAFVYRRSDGTPWHAGQAIDRTDALAAYTEWGVLGLPERVRRGRIREGYDADLTVVTGDPFDDPKATVLLTIVGGSIRYARDSVAPG